MDAVLRSSTLRGWVETRTSAKRVLLSVDAQLTLLISTRIGLLFRFMLVLAGVLLENVYVILVMLNYVIWLIRLIVVQISVTIVCVATVVVVAIINKLHVIYYHVSRAFLLDHWIGCPHSDGLDLYVVDLGLIAPDLLEALLPCSLVLVDPVVHLLDVGSHLDQSVGLLGLLGSSARVV